MSLTEADIQKEIEAIKARNSRVELDKAWETSWMRRIFITLATYIIAGIWLAVIDEPYHWLKAVVPAIGYILSTLSMPFIKKLWLEQQEEAKNNDD